MLTPPEAFDERKLPRTTGTLPEHVAEKLDDVVGDEFELCQRSFHFNLYAVYGGRPGGVCRQLRIVVHFCFLLSAECVAAVG